LTDGQTERRYHSKCRS